VADGLALPHADDDPAWAHLLVEAARVTGSDRDAVLHDAADPADLLRHDRLSRQRAAVDPGRRADVATSSRTGGTTVVCAVDRGRTAVTLIQSNASGWGAHIVEPATGVFLHDRGIGFSVAEGHPAMWAP